MTFSKKGAPKDCEPNCKGLIVDKANGVYCRHLEALLPRPTHHSVKLWNCAFQIGNLTDEEWANELFAEREIPEYEVAQRLRLFGLDPHETDLVMLRCVEGRKMSQIVEAQGWLNQSSANYHLRKTLLKLRQGKFRL